jgi:hypothetical protein
MPVRKFGDDTHYNTRALQAYQILIGLAANRQTLTYGLLSERMSYAGGRGEILAHPLGLHHASVQSKRSSGANLVGCRPEDGSSSFGVGHGRR